MLRRVHLEEGTDVILGDGGVQAPELDPAILYGDCSLVDASEHEARQGRVGLYLPCHGRIQGCHPRDVDGQRASCVYTCSKTTGFF